LVDSSFPRLSFAVSPPIDIPSAKCHEGESLCTVLPWSLLECSLSYVPQSLLYFPLTFGKGFVPWGEADQGITNAVFLRSFPLFPFPGAFSLSFFL